MNKKYFVLKLIPPRLTFPQDMTENEKGIMHQHITYWTKLMAEGKVIIFGPVLDPLGTYGLGIVQLTDEKELKGLIGDDPANGLNTYEYYPMMAVVPVNS